MSVQALSAAFAARGFTPSEKLVLLALSNYANDQMQCWPSQERLAADTELSPRTVWSALKALEQRGALVRTSRKRADGTRTTDVFTLRLSPAEPVATAAESTRKSCETHSQILQEPVATVATLTTFEPSTEPTRGTSSEANASARTPDEKAWDQAACVLVAQGGMTLKAAKTFFGGLLKAHGLEPRDMLGPLAEAEAKGTADPQSWLKRCALQRQRRQTGPPKRVGFV